jgi:hypothetical protein
LQAVTFIELEVLSRFGRFRHVDAEQQACGDRRPLMPAPTTIRSYSSPVSEGGGQVRSCRRAARERPRRSRDD